jgi:transmembrane sensor
MPPNAKSFDANVAAQQAADWLARRDRGLNAAEQDDYLQWLREDARHAALIARHEATFGRLQQLERWQPGGSSEPNPNLFARPRRTMWRWVPLVSAMAAAAVVGGLVLQRNGDRPVATASAKSFLRVNEQQVLSDGSKIELREGSRVEVAFTETERRVRLTGGEAHFTVAKNPAWPFVVEAGKVAVRAVGTAFAVRLDAASVDVVVTEGKVRVESPAVPGQATAPTEAPLVMASHRAVVALDSAAREPEVTPVTAEQLKDALAWQAPRFQFHETPLADAVAEFNRHNPGQTVIVEAELERVPIGGIFRVDNVSGFVSLLEVTLGIQSERRADGAVELKRGR